MKNGSKHLQKDELFPYDKKSAPTMPLADGEFESPAKPRQIEHSPSVSANKFAHNSYPRAIAFRNAVRKGGRLRSLVSYGARTLAKDIFKHQFLQLERYISNEGFSSDGPLQMFLQELERKHPRYRKIILAVPLLVKSFPTGARPDDFLTKNSELSRLLTVIARGWFALQQGPKSVSPLPRFDCLSDSTLRPDIFCLEPTTNSYS